MFSFFRGATSTEESDVMTSFGLTVCSAVYYQVSHCRFLISKKFFLFLGVIDTPEAFSAPQNAQFCS
jgi:hypothetical protein